MGRIKTKYIKRKTKEIIGKYGDKFTTDYEENKRIISEKYKFLSKKIRNIVAGYATRLTKKSENF
ncbi:MAG: small subunit ribosomal protein S17e [Candidatus Woesearchaeota archaeon]|nr:small subunit ribosomal protein S17e [Candidatus Woesearchaeota archaeon]